MNELAIFGTSDERKAADHSGLRQDSVCRAEDLVARLRVEEQAAVEGTMRGGARVNGGAGNGERRNGPRGLVLDVGVAEVGDRTCTTRSDVL